MIDTQNLVWLDRNQSKNIPKDVKIWLYDEQSLTKKLKYQFKLFSVNVVSQKNITPCLGEKEILAYDGVCVEREVELLGDGNAVVYARSVIPKTIDTVKLLNIGTKPLGEVLFNSSNISREVLQITNINGVWGRRSIFTVGDTRVLVSEFFLNTLFL
jgi:chorismate--pyruvate lyase